MHIPVLAVDCNDYRTSHDNHRGVPLCACVIVTADGMYDVFLPTELDYRGSQRVHRLHETVRITYSHSIGARHSL